MDDPVAIALKCRADVILAFVPQASTGLRAPSGLRRENLAFALLELFAKHHAVIVPRKLTPFASGPTPNTSASVWPTSANVWRVPRLTPWRTRSPVTSNGTYSRAWSVLAVV